VPSPQPSSRTRNSSSEEEQDRRTPSPSSQADEAPTDSENRHTRGSTPCDARLTAVKSADADGIGKDESCHTCLHMGEDVHEEGTGRKRKAEVIEDDDEEKCSGKVARVDVPNSLVPRTLQIDYYRRSWAMKRRKWRHMDWLDATQPNRESLILNTVLSDCETALEPNMFPYDCPDGISHWTLWSKEWLTDEAVDQFMQSWMKENLPKAVEWQVDDNMSEGLSIQLFHVHVYIRCGDA
jgi:hypothetical protein